MPDIGATLREARMRQRIDISDIEAQTKIRAKYLRALENEEWDLLPGPTFVKTFLRTYAEALGLDARMLLEEYKMRYERLSEAELMPISPQTARQRERAAKRGRGPSIGRDVLIAALVVGLVALLILLGRGGGNSETTPTATDSVARTTPTTTKAAGGAASGATTTTKKTAPSTVRLRLTPTGPVYVCLKAGSRVLIREQTLTPATPARTYRAKSFKVLLGNSSLTMTIDGRRRTVPPTAKPVAYAITPRGRRPIPADTTTICA
jgi:cytoskeleton protein RodZ